MGWFKHLGLKKLLFGLFIFEYSKLSLLDKGVHKLFEGVYNFYLRGVHNFI